ncbi:MAG: hypothetical protein MJY95_03860 [Bacteroidaceae bacterium]|nr:hypothetical protein [Bacteroidaceae bacterium]
MKKFLIVALTMVVSIVSASAQTLEQRKICALKWTLQQSFYNKEVGQQISHLDVTEFKSFEEFQKNKYVSEAISKLTDKTDQSRVNNIISAKEGDDVSAYIPTNGKGKYQEDVEKIKSQSPAEEEETEEAVEQEDTTKKEAIQPVEEPTDEAEAADEAVAGEESAEGGAATGGVSFWLAVLIAFLVYAILTACLYFFHKGHKNEVRTEPMVTLEQYRSERVRLLERIKAVEIQMENMKGGAAANQKAEAPKPQPQAAQPSQPAQPTVENKPAVNADLFGKPAVENKPAAPAAPAVPVEGVPQPPRRRTAILFFPVPVEGVFANGTEEIEMGKSLYMLKTTDGENGTFTILNTPEAIGTALISLSEMVKPVCKILNTVDAPLEIVTEAPGQAVREGNSWRVVSKSVVRLI